MDTSWRIALSIFAATFFGPIMTRALGRAFPARASDWMEYQSLRHRYRRLELAAQVAALVGVIASAWLLIVLRVANTPWFVGVVLGWAVLAPILLISLLTLPRGVACWKDFWRFYEVTYRISLRFLAPIYIVICALGIVSTAMVFSHL